jgi:hypothetical protein
MEQIDIEQPSGDAPAPDVVPALDALDQLESEEQQHQEQPSPEEAERQEELNAARLEGARMAADGMIGGAFVLLTQKLPYVDVPESKRQQLAEKLAPVLAKSGGGMPEWLVPYKEEFEFGMCLAGVGFGVFMQVQQHKKQQYQKPAQPSGGEGSGAGQATALAPVGHAPEVDPLDPNAEE